jgi:hypothetical protein
MNFGKAIEAMKEGNCVRRSGWNGKGMHIYVEDHFHCLVGKGGGLEHTRKYEPVIIMFTAQRTHQPGWLASQADILSDDWEVLSSEQVNKITPAKEQGESGN